jgi:hypothetical protein
LEIGAAALTFHAGAFPAEASPDNWPADSLPAVLDRLPEVVASVGGNHGLSHAGSNPWRSLGPARLELGALALGIHANLDNWPAYCIPAALNRMLEIGASVGGNHGLLHAGSNRWRSLGPACFEPGAIASGVHASLDNWSAYCIPAVLDSSFESRGAHRLGTKKRGEQHQHDREQR